MNLIGTEAGGLEEDAMAGLCASLAALVIALDEAGALHRSRYEKILRHIRLTFSPQQAEACGEAIIDQVIDLVREHGPGLTGRHPDLDLVRRSLSAKTGAYATAGSDDRRTGDVDNRRRHAPLLGAPFVVER